MFRLIAICFLSASFAFAQVESSDKPVPTPQQIRFLGLFEGTLALFPTLTAEYTKSVDSDNEAFVRLFDYVDTVSAFATILKTDIAPAAPTEILRSHLVTLANEMLDSAEAIEDEIGDTDPDSESYDPSLEKYLEEIREKISSIHEDLRNFYSAAKGAPLEQGKDRFVELKRQPQDKYKVNVLGETLALTRVLELIASFKSDEHYSSAAAFSELYSTLAFVEHVLEKYKSDISKVELDVFLKSALIAELNRALRSVEGIKKRYVTDRSEDDFDQEVFVEQVERMKKQLDKVSESLKPLIADMGRQSERAFVTLDELVQHIQNEPKRFDDGLKQLTSEVQTNVQNLEAKLSEMEKTAEQNRQLIQGLEARKSSLEAENTRLGEINGGLKRAQDDLEKARAAMLARIDREYRAERSIREIVDEVFARQGSGIVAVESLEFKSGTDDYLDKQKYGSLFNDQVKKLIENQLIYWRAKVAQQMQKNHNAEALEQFNMRADVAINKIHKVGIFRTKGFKVNFLLSLNLESGGVQTTRQIVMLDVDFAFSKKSKTFKISSADHLIGGFEKAIETALASGNTSIDGKSLKDFIVDLCDLKLSQVDSSKL